MLNNIENAIMAQLKNTASDIHLSINPLSIPHICKGHRELVICYILITIHKFS